MYNFTWGINISGATITNNHQRVQFLPYQTRNTGTGDDSDFFPVGTNNLSRTLSVTFKEDGQSDGYNDHATNYNTRTKNIVIIDSYGGSNPSCLLEGTPIEMAMELLKKLKIYKWVIGYYL